MKRKILTAAALAGVLSLGGAMADDKPFGGPDSVAYAQDLWKALSRAGLAGWDAYETVPYDGQHPHGAVLQTIEGKLTVKGHTGEVIVKRNYGGEGISKSKVAENPNDWLKAVTVMFRRESGYDSDNANWFWAKYLPDGSLDKNPKGMELAGRVAKGKDAGCIACHVTAPGDDYVFNHDRY